MRQSLKMALIGFDRYNLIMCSWRILCSFSSGKSTTSFHSTWHINQALNQREPSSLICGKMWWWLLFSALFLFYQSHHLLEIGRINEREHRHIINSWLNLWATWINRHTRTNKPTQKHTHTQTKKKFFSFYFVIIFNLGKLTLKQTNFKFQFCTEFIAYNVQYNRPIYHRKD